MEAPRFAWVLNLDADLELAQGGGYTSSRRVVEAMRPLLAIAARALVREEDVIVDASTPARSAAGLVGRAFCPTPRALEILERAGATPEPHPAFDVLRRVNSRAFAAELGATLPGAAFVHDAGRAFDMLRASPEVGDAWRLKRAFGMTGRGQRRIAPGALSDADQRFLLAAIAAGGVMIEPDVPIVDEYAIHGDIPNGAGRSAFGEIVLQRCDAHGAWLATERLGVPDPGAPAALDDEASGAREIEAISLDEVVSRLRTEVEMVGRALRRAGYFGPYGVDAYTYRDHEGRLRLSPRSEINARYSMGFAVGFGRIDSLSRALDQLRGDAGAT